MSAREGPFHAETSPPGGQSQQSWQRPLRMEPHCPECGCPEDSKVSCEIRS